MKILYLDCSMGMDGDMLMAALLELVPDKKEFIEKINRIGIPSVTITGEKSIKCGITGLHVNVQIKGKEEHTEGHEHNHVDSHHHMAMQSIIKIINYLQIPEQVKKDVIEVYQIIADAESIAHGKEVSEVHFHEVGMMDAIADITGCALLLYELNIDQIIASPVNVGFGQVKCAHGILPVPAPATANILIGIPSYTGSIMGELCTPTGAALLRHFVTFFSKMPLMSIERIGYGMGTKDFEEANCVRAMMGNSVEDPFLS